MKRGLAVLAVLLVMAAPAAWVGVPGAKAGSTTTIRATERGGTDPALYACYTVIDLAGGEADRADGPLAGGPFCDGWNGDAPDGEVVATTALECDPCRVVQSYPDTPQNKPTMYLPEPPLEQDEGEDFLFRPYLKPIVVVTVRDAQTNRLVKGACVNLSNIERGGGVFSGCDGKLVNGYGDQDGKKNGKIRTTRLDYPGAHRITTPSPFPNGYRAAKAVRVNAGPAEAGEVKTVTVKLRPKG